jgi:hypothetical protein
MLYLKFFRLAGWMALPVCSAAAKGRRAVFAGMSVDFHGGLGYE